MSTNNMDRFEFRCIRPEETQQAIEIEQICFPPNEACSPKSLTERIKATAETFLVAEDKETGKLAAFLNGVPTDEDAFRDEFFTDISLINPEGKNIMLLGLFFRKPVGRDELNPLRIDFFDCLLMNDIFRYGIESFLLQYRMHLFHLYADGFFQPFLNHISFLLR